MCINGAYVLDIVDEEDADRAQPRGRTIGAVTWWCELATAESVRQKWTHLRLAAEVSRRIGRPLHQTAITRVLNGKILAVKIAEEVSAILGIPPPVFFPASANEALALVGARELYRVRAQVAVLRAGVEKRIEERQEPQVPSEDGAVPRRQPKHGRAGRARP